VRIALLDIVANIPGAGELRARSYESLGIAPDAAMVDVGCGSGRAVAEMAERARGRSASTSPSGWSLWPAGAGRPQQM
jgi:hypothetical protein